MKRTGACLRCGACCESVVIALFQEEDANAAEKRSAQDFLEWASAHEGVTWGSPEPGVAEIRFAGPCRHLGRDEEGKATCAIYDRRFDMCRRFPEKPAKRCKGFKFEEERC